MRKRIIAPVIISFLLALFTTSAIASGNNNRNCGKCHDKSMREALKFSVNEYTGTEDANPSEDFALDSLDDGNSDTEIDSTKVNSSNKQVTNN